MNSALDTVISGKTKMTSARNFHYDDYLRAFRATCAQRGIDPLQGATGFQVVHFLADRQQARLSDSRDRWWERSDLWQDCPPYRSETEEDAFWHLFRDAYVLTVLRVIRAERRRRMRLSLLELHQLQARRKSG
jgi:hypothetical protein